MYPEVLINTNTERLPFEGESGLYHQMSYPSTPLSRALNWPMEGSSKRLIIVGVRIFIKLMGVIGTVKHAEV